MAAAEEAITTSTTSSHSSFREPPLDVAITVPMLNILPIAGNYAAREGGTMNRTGPMNGAISGFCDLPDQA
ncbi:hypothetical protein HHA04nite_29580 [Halomonas halophila]|uniref:Uncharacterized protein n=1 Tax=Halomonas halophila TaxID=29573 RepID=A0ABQ0U7B6_9GAMM|nr:hypothetical protein HHA04nite_29580 [Halomonas halophila]